MTENNPSVKKHSFKKTGFDLTLSLIAVIFAGSVFFLTHKKGLGPLPEILLFAGSIPLAKDIYSGLIRRQIPLEFPVLFTLLALSIMNRMDIASIFLLLILAGHIFRLLIQKKVQDSVLSLAQYLPVTAWKKIGGELVSVSPSTLLPGDEIIVKPGERVPVDGVLSGERGTVDESVITGESRPVEKIHGQKLVSASINIGSPIQVTVTTSSSQSTLYQMQKLVEESQRQSNPLSLFTTRYAGWTSVSSLIVVSFYYLWKKDIDQSLALWISLVPMIFAIIVPVSTTIGISLLARRGILVKSSEVLENVTKVDTLCFDKTGTLTQGTPLVLAIITNDNKEQILDLAASLERYSEHSLARPIIDLFEKTVRHWLPVKEIRVLEGLGMEGTWEGHQIVLGNRHMFLKKGWDIPVYLEARAKEKEDEGATPVFLGWDHNVRGVILIADRLRPEAPQVLKRLSSQGYRTIMLTGDISGVSRNIAREAGVLEYHAELSPDAKVAIVQALRDSKKKVMMVGDGLNDAPVLARADVGVAMGLRGVDLSLEAAGVVLVRDDLNTIPILLNKAHTTFSTIRANLYMASVIHLCGAFLVITGQIGLLGAALLHQISSGIVLLNTARLFVERTPRETLSPEHHSDQA
jgi:heavy metal translocating P-type ATPase